MLLVKSRLVCRAGAGRVCVLADAASVIWLCWVWGSCVCTSSGFGFIDGSLRIDTGGLGPPALLEPAPILSLWMILSSKAQPPPSSPLAAGQLMCPGAAGARQPERAVLCSDGGYSWLCDSQSCCSHCWGWNPAGPALATRPGKPLALGGSTQLAPRFAPERVRVCGGGDCPPASARSARDDILS